MRRVLRRLLPVFALIAMAAGLLALELRLDLTGLDLLRSASLPASRTAPAREAAVQAPSAPGRTDDAASTKPAAAGESAARPAPAVRHETDETAIHSAGRQELPSPDDRPAAATSTPQEPRIEFARIDPDGASVIGGRAAPGARVTLLADGKPVAVAEASAAGQWSAIVTQRFAPGPLSLGIETETTGATARSVGPTLAVVVPKGSGRVELAAAAATPRPILPSRSAADEATGRQRLAEIVDKVRAADGRTDVRDGSRPVPVAITFVTGRATLTPDGVRATELLVEFLRLVRPQGITLSGHADVRGGDAYNFELSRQRLETVERHLRRSGYTGRLSLIPRGRTEPYKGIDRTALGREAVFQADRRVELRVVE